MTHAAPLAVPLSTAPRPRYGVWASLGLFYFGLAVTYVPSQLPAATGPICLASGLFLALLLAPMEYALGALAFSFVAAASRNTSTLFSLLRWVALGGAAVIFPLRFFLRQRRPASYGIFDYLLALFVGLSGVTLMSTVSFNMTALKLGTMACLWYVLALGAYHVADTYGPAAPRRLVWGLLAYPAGLVFFSLLHSVFSFGADTMVRGWFIGLMTGPNSWAAFVVTLLPWLGGLLMSTAAGRGRRHLMLAASLCLTAYTLILSGSRAALLGALAAATLFAVVHASRRVAAVLAVVTLLFGVRLLADPEYLPTLVRTYIYKHREGQADVFQSRLEPWKRAQENFRERPWLGYGFGVTNEAQADWRTDVESGRGAVETGSSIWGTLAQVGILGSAALFSALLWLLVRAGRFCWGVRDPSLTAVYGSVLALTANAVFEGWLIAPGNYVTVYFWVQCFLLNGMMCRYRPASVRSPAARFSSGGWPDPSRRPAGVV